MCAEHNTRSSIGNSCNSSVDTSTLLIFTIVLKLLIDMHRVLKASAQNLVYPVLDSPQPLHQRLKFLVCKLSGNPCKTPPDIVEVIMQYRRDGTHRQYNVYIKKSLQFDLWWRVTWSSESICEICFVFPAQSRQERLKLLCTEYISLLESPILTLKSMIFMILHQWASTSLFATTLRVFSTRSNLCQNTAKYGLWALCWII